MLEEDKNMADVMKAYNESEDKEAFIQSINMVGVHAREMIEVVKQARKRLIAQGLIEDTDENL
jgi:hypothetical protein